MYAIYIYLRILVSKTISKSDDVRRLAVKRLMSQVEQELLTLRELLSSLPVFSGICVAQLLVFCAVFCIELYCLHLFDLRLLITTLVFYDLSCTYIYYSKLQEWAKSVTVTYACRRLPLLLPNCIITVNFKYR